MELLGSFLVRLVPVMIPIILIWSFLVNHGMAPSGGSKKSNDSKKSGGDSDKPKPPEV